MKGIIHVLVVALLVGLAGSLAEGQARPALIVGASDYAFKIPATVKAGFVTIDLVNAGAEPHHAQIARLNPGVSRSQVREALKKGPAEALRLVTLTGGPGMTAPHGRTRVSLELLPGDYLIACFIESPDRTPHLAKGMLAFFTVTGRRTRGSLNTAGQIALSDFHIQMPAGFTGKGIYRVVNRGAQPHEVEIFRLAPGKTLADTKAFLSDPAQAGRPPVIPVAGAQGIMRGTVNYLHLNLSPGTYMAVCFIPDLASGKPHMALGMMSTFQVK